MARSEPKVRGGGGGGFEVAGAGGDRLDIAGVGVTVVVEGGHGLPRGSCGCGCSGLTEGSAEVKVMILPRPTLDPY